MLAKAIFSSGAAAVLAATVGFVTWPTWRSEPGRMEFPGVVEMHDIGLASKVCGRVWKVLVDEGDLVEPGQALVRLDAAELAARRAAQNARLEAARLRLALARRGPTPEAVAAAQAAVNAAAARCERVESGPRKEMITQTQAELRLAEVTLNEKQATLRRLEPLAKNSVVAQVDLDRARSEMQQAAALRQQAASRFEMLQKGARAEELKEAAALLAQAQAEYNDLAAGTREEEIAIAAAQVAEFEAELAQLQIQYDETTIRAPVVGVVESLSVRPGDLLAANQPAVRLLSKADIWVKIFVPETDLGKLQIRQSVNVSVDSHPGRTFSGQVSQIASTAEFTPRNVQTIDSRRHQVFAVKIRISDDDGIFKSGMAACVELRSPESNRSKNRA